MEASKLCDSFYCRLCAEENKNGTNLFSTDENSDNYNLSQLVNRYLPLKIENDGKYPRFICPGCHIQLEATKSFMDLIVNGQAKLRELYRNQQEVLHREEKQRRKLEEVLHTVNPNSSVETYTIQSDETGEKFLIQIFSDGPLFPPEHELPLRAEGLEKPRRKRGRPPKQVVEEVEAKADTNQPEVAQQEEDSETDADGRKRRKIKAPSRYQGIVQGKELEMVFKEEGLTEDEDEGDGKDAEASVGSEEVIGRIEMENGEELQAPVYINRPKFRMKSDYKKKNKKRYPCEICKREFLHFGRYKLHKKSHKMKYVCQEEKCGTESLDKAVVEQHQSETGHTGINVVEIVESAGGTVQLPEGVADLINETETGSSTPSASSYKCQDCNKTFICKQNLDVHRRAVHNQEKPFCCDKCDKKFSYANSLKLHMLRHEKDATDNPAKEYPCEQCGKVLHHPSSLIYHRETEHSNGRRFICNKCNKSFKHSQLLQRHQLVHSDERPFRCSECLASFKTHANLTNHEAVHTGEKKFVCNKCGQRFAHRTSLTLHQRWHEGYKPHTCDVCHKSFSQKGNLAEHKRIHTGEKPYCCDHCGRSFTTSSQFSLHRKRHTGEKPWTCSFCGKSFLHKDTFKTHVRRHLNDRPFSCKACGGAFTEAWALKRHERTHSGVKPYSCDICHKTFADNSNKRKHMRIHGCGRNQSDDNTKFPNMAPANVKYILSDSLLNPIYEEQFEIKDSPPLLNILDTTESKREVADLHLTQLVDQEGNPISVTTPDGQMVPVVTGADDEANLQGLLPDGTLIPIELTSLQSKEVVEDVPQQEDGAALLEPEAQDGLTVLKQHIITGDDGQEVCLVTYNVDDNCGVNPEIGIDSFLIENMKN
ncbi:hypothetical protein NQ315_015823 [Exocentrus adspersus]|uniref:Uncharacterized protein n=1 Tax=Exocentrus adspersus TaxID=1586481 RepID=A0AAV8W405_9CUCU|nr:hypothetical protein NQ315_015823 [Exocentrus adspersus]